MHLSMKVLFYTKTLNGELVITWLVNIAACLLDCQLIAQVRLTEVEQNNNYGL